MDYFTKEDAVIVLLTIVLEKVTRIPRNFRIFHAGIRGRRGAAEGNANFRGRISPRGIKGRTRSFFRCLSSVFYRQFSRHDRIAFMVIYLVNPLPRRPFRPGNPVRRAHPSDPAGRGHLSPMPNRSHP